MFGLKLSARERANDEAEASLFAAARPRFSHAAVISAAALGIALALTLALWAHYGTAVFYEMIAAGIAACL
jgi:hypothetical protein